MRNEKTPCSSSSADGVNKKTAKTRRVRSRGQDKQVNELLKLCLRKVCQLQQDLNNADNMESDAEAAGYAACAVETLKFLADEGLPPNHPIVETLSKNLLDKQE